MAENLTKKEKGFADDYLDHGNGTLAAKNNYDVANDNTAASLASQTLRKLKIQEYLESNAEPVARNMINLALNAESEQVQVAAGKDVLDRAGYKPVDKSQSVVVNFKADAKDIDKFKGLREEYENKLRDNIINSETL